MTFNAVSFIFCYEKRCAHTYFRNRNKKTKKRLEIDFVAARGSEKIYIQSAFAMTTPEKRMQEERPLNAIGDSFRKIIIVRDNIKARRNEQGIVTIGVRHFLMDENSLSL